MSMSEYPGSARVDKHRRELLEQADAYRLRRLARAGQAVRPSSPSAASRGMTGFSVARFVRDVDDERSAEVAVTVVDDWQCLGLGTRLVSRLTDRAWTEGVTRFTALVLDENVAAKRLLWHLPGTPVVVDSYEDRVEYVVELSEGGRG
ncbi:MAG: N-acetyltransferase family protein [Jatrophihabitans sp.]|uniref:GNAT family N-acetyltransferase n=1 Tax=Jatrophihabitans sp. TaxID=1932789 RepID=UPI00390E4261